MITTDNNLLNITDIFYEPVVKTLPRGVEVLAQFPNASLHEVDSHWNISHLHGSEGSAEHWNQIKRNVLVLGTKKSITSRPNSRSSHFVAPSLANGCTMSCIYCYVPRRKGYANPITLFVNIEQILRHVQRHAAKQGIKLEPDQIDPAYWVYDIGENSDCSVDALLSNNIKDTIELFKQLPNAKASFATKYVNNEMLAYDPQGKARIRFSLMPQGISKIIDVRTSPVHTRIQAINNFVDAGWEVHINFSPVVYYEGWIQDYTVLFEEINDVLTEKAKRQLKCEVIFLTHNDRLHEVNLQWHPKGEAYIWQPEIQETKYSQTGGRNLRYKRNLKAELVDQFRELLSAKLPYCEIRYIF
jgi:spore photoproduct lyase family protein